MMKRILWGLFWAYQIIGCLVAMYYWEEFVNFYYAAKWVMEGML